jgi:tetratricopeptide (TPR) repeat protein
MMLVIILLLSSTSFALIGAKEGEVPKKFTLNDLNGSPVNIGTYIGKKPVILVFWELPMSKSFLDYSLDELRFLNNFYEKHHDTSGLEIFAIYTPEEDKEISDSEMERVKSLIQVNKIKFNVLIDTGFEVFREYGVIALPSTIMIDKSGKIKFIYPSFPLAAQPLFTEKIGGLIGLAQAVSKKGTEKARGTSTQSVRLYNYALQMYKKGLLEQSLSPLKKSLELDPGASSSHNLMGIVLWKKGNYEGAVDEFKRAIELDKNSAPAHFNYGLLLFENETYNEAKKHIELSISINSNLAEAHYVLGILYEKTEAANDGIKELEKALALFENKKTSTGIHDSSFFCRISTLYTLSKLYVRNGDDKKAMELLLKAAQISLGIEGNSEEGLLHLSRDMMIYE